MVSFVPALSAQTFMRSAASQVKSLSLIVLGGFLFFNSGSSENSGITLVHALNVAVPGATGRVGRLVVDRCLKSGHQVTALVRDIEKANDLFSDRSEEVTIRRIDFGELVQKEANDIKMYVESAFEGVDSTIWCASGFVDVPDETTSDGGDVTMKKESLDVVGMTHLLPSLVEPYLNPLSKSTSPPPAFVMLSSAGVTRPDWDDVKKGKFVGCADIPIVRMNPGGILGKKVEAENMLRQALDNGFPYCIVRPTGLKFKAEEWPRGRSLLSQGDVAVGRMNADDLAELLVDILDEPSATGKTFECVTLADYPPPMSWSPVLDRLERDTDYDDSDAKVYASYQLMQQLLPGENQDATRLEMGRTYEQVDSGEVRARERGAAPTEREIQMVSGVVNNDIGRESKGFRDRFRNMFTKSRS